VNPRLICSLPIISHPITTGVLVTGKAPTISSRAGLPTVPCAAIRRGNGNNARIERRASDIGTPMSGRLMPIARRTACGS